MRSLRGQLQRWKLRQCDLDAFAGLQSSGSSATPNELQSPPSHYEHVGFLSHLTPAQLEESPDDFLSFHIDEPLESIERIGIIEKDLKSVHTELLQAVTSKQIRTINKLLGHCKFVDGSESLLHYAVVESSNPSRDQLDSVREILRFAKSAGWDIDHIDGHGRTAVELAIRSRNAPILDLLLSNGASANHVSTQGYSPLHMAIFTQSSPEIYRCLLQRGANPNMVSTNNFHNKTPGQTMPLGLAVMRLGAASLTNDRDSTAWFKIAGLLIEHNAIYTSRETDLMLHHFSQAWNRTGGSQNLGEDAYPLLSALMKRGLDPTAPSNGHGPFRCECQSLAHQAFFHSRSDVFGKWIIDACQPSKHGIRLLQCLLKGCADNFVPRPSSSNLLRHLMNREFPFPADFHIIEGVLDPGSHHKWEQQGALLNTLLSLKTDYYVLPPSSRSRHAAILETVALCQFTTLRCKLAEELLQQRISSIITTGGSEDVRHHRANRPVSVHFAELLSELETLISRQSTSDKMYEALRRTLDYHGPHRKPMLGCFVHFVTLSMIQGADNGGTMSKSKLSYLLKLRKEFELRDVHIPNTLVLDMLKGAPEAYARLKELEKFFTHEDMIMNE